MGTVLLCEDSLEGVFTGIYKAYERKENHKECKVQAGQVNNYELFAQYVEIKPEDELAGKVSRTICRDLGMEAYRAICQALAAEDDDKADAVYHTVVEGLKHHGKSSNGFGQAAGSIMGNLTNPYVRKVFELSRSTEFEIMRIKQFLRFKELENGILVRPLRTKCRFPAP